MFVVTGPGAPMPCYRLREMSWVLPQGVHLNPALTSPAAKVRMEVRQGARQFLRVQPAAASAGASAAWPAAGAAGRCAGAARTVTRMRRPLAVWMVAPVAMPTRSGLPSSLKVNLLPGQKAVGGVSNTPASKYAKERPPTGDTQPQTTGTILRS